MDYVRCRICCVEECGAYAHMASDTTTLACDFRHVVLGNPLIDFPTLGDFCQFNLPHDKRGGVALNLLQILAYRRAFLPYKPPFSGEEPGADSDEGEEKLSKPKQAIEDAREAEKKELQQKK